MPPTTLGWASRRMYVNRTRTLVTLRAGSTSRSGRTSGPRRTRRAVGAVRPGSTGDELLGELPVFEWIDNMKADGKIAVSSYNCLTESRFLTYRFAQPLLHLVSSRS